MVGHIEPTSSLVIDLAVRPFPKRVQPPEGLHLYTVFSSKGSMPIPAELVLQIFPDIAVKAWRPHGVKLRGKVAAVADYIVQRLDGQEGVSMTKSELKAAAGIKGGNMDRVWKHPALADWLDHHGLKMTVQARSVELLRHSIRT
jgi:hypothetical protein